jgi:hypothetical protein
MCFLLLLEFLKISWFNRQTFLKKTRNRHQKFIGKLKAFFCGKEVLFDYFIGMGFVFSNGSTG